MTLLLCSLLLTACVSAYNLCALRLCLVEGCAWLGAQALCMCMCVFMFMLMFMCMSHETHLHPSCLCPPCPLSASPPCPPSACHLLLRGLLLLCCCFCCWWKHCWPLLLLLPCPSCLLWPAAVSQQHNSQGTTSTGTGSTSSKCTLHNCTRQAVTTHSAKNTQQEHTTLLRRPQNSPIDMMHPGACV